jgi:chaperone BCS1
MANYLKFDIYDLELTEVKSNSDLRRLLVGMSNRSILVVEDIDCSIELQQREDGEKRARSSSAEVAEVLMRNENSDVVLQDLLEFLKAKRKEVGERKAANENGNE